MLDTLLLLLGAFVLFLVVGHIACGLLYLGCCVVCSVQEWWATRGLKLP